MGSNRKAYLREYQQRPDVKARRYTREQKPEFKAQQKERRKQLKTEVIPHYSQGKNECACCGDKHFEFLTINHIDGGRYGKISWRKHIKNLRITFGANFWRWLVKNNFPDGYNVLCLNCNFALGQNGYCPHQKEREGIG